MTSPKSSHWDIFCAVVDNYGDIGVTWRLSKQLAREYQLPIVLWVDDLKSFAHILPTLNPTLGSQTLEGVTINQWNIPLNIDYTPGAVLIEAFACELPDEVKAIAKCAPTPPLWLNLEYLSAEDWVDGCHGLPSLQSGGINKYFYMPGFSAASGGLICEKSLFDERDAWQADSANKRTLFRSLGLSGIKADDKVVSLFSYETLALEGLCALWQASSSPVHLLVPKGRSLNSLASYLPKAPADIAAGEQFCQGALTIHILPMTDQTGYDRLLWSADFNIVRGEDSFLRAQWAGRPFIWHIYQQEEDYHLVKLEAFMRLYCDNLAPEITDCWKNLNLAFNQQQADAVQQHWQNIESFALPLLAHAKQWPIDALKTTDLATRLVQFVKKSLR